VLQSKLVATDEVTGRAFVDAFEDTPVVLMSEGGDPDDVMRAVTLGAVDFLDKPLSVLRLKNIWQHSVRKMMQQATLYDPPQVSGPTKSEPGPMHHSQHHSSISDCLPSSMTAPIGLAPCAIPKSASSKLLPPRSSIDSPGTPSADNADDPAEAISAGSGRYQLDSSGMGGGTALSLGTLGEQMVVIEDTSAMLLGSELCDVVDSAATDVVQAAHTRPPLSYKPSSFGALVPVPPVSQWPALDPGCVWGTPVGRPLPAPLSVGPPATWQQQSSQQSSQPLHLPTQPVAIQPRDSPRPVLVKNRSSIDVQGSAPAPTVLPSTAAPQAASAPGPILPSAFLSLEKAKEEGGPIGLKLRKSGSLLDMINAALAAPARTGLDVQGEAKSI